MHGYKHCDKTARRSWSGSSDVQENTERARAEDPYGIPSHNGWIYCCFQTRIRLLAMAFLPR